MKVFLLVLLSTNILFANAVVFMYHHFGKDKYPSTNIKLEQFEKQLDYLKSNNYNLWPLSRLLNAVKYKSHIPQKTVVLTIDDAYISVYKNAYPMLKQRNFPYTVFVNTNAIGTKSINYMTWEHMKEMKMYGAEFANHSSTHAYLMPKKNQSVYEWQKMIKDEIDDAQESLQKNLGSSTNTNPKILSYPFGEYTEKTARYIESLGYIGVAQTSGVVNYKTDLKHVPRFAMAEKFASIEDFKLKLNMLPLAVKSANPWGTHVQLNPPKLTLELDKPVTKLGCYIASGKAIEVQWKSSTRFEVQAPSSLRPPRDRYTCTYVDKNGQWYWYSHLWILDSD